MEAYPTFFLAGKLNGIDDPAWAFNAYWIGSPPLDAGRASAWSVRSFDVFRQFFADPSRRPYTLLVRPYARPRDGGGASNGGVMLEYG
ncbi:hypothetical protein M9978_20145 [Sphingomonas sp. MG17]|uniref:Uncharacterized protein n=2 Tax=Sphingomonas tagetis TaxID=2949092 RepID=A0A9X2KRF4_9SPHN|nr:hypothetical protein [Sphingomonas tagetis]